MEVVTEPDHQPDETYDSGQITRGFSSFISEKEFPCLAARGIGKREDFTIRSYGRMNSVPGIIRLGRDLVEYTRLLENRSGVFRTFVAVFPDDPVATEENFERRLWSVLASLSELDEEEWDDSVSSDPSEKDFAFSFAGEAYYVVGLHPGAGRPARRFSYPALVFNRHRTFQELRASGNYQRMRDLIRERDRRTNGSVNPMLTDFGTASEAAQYSGRHVEEDWKCPFAELFRQRQRSNDSRKGGEQDERI